MVKESTPATAALLQSAKSYLGRGQTDRAESICRTVLATSPRNVEAILLLANIQLHLDKPGEAEKFFRAAITYDPKNAGAHVELARLYRKTGRQGLAIEECREVIRATPGSAAAHLVLGICYVDLWEIRKAIEALSKAVELEPTSAVGFDRYGFALQMWGRNQEAIAAYRKAIELDPNLLNAHVNLSHVLDRVGESAESTAIFELAFARACGSAEELSIVARAMVAQGRDERAEVALRAADARSGGAIEQRMLLVQFLGRAGKWVEARSLLQQLEKQLPEDASILHELVYSKRMEETDRPLISRMNKLVTKRTPDPKDPIRLSYALGKLHDDLGEYAEAFKHFAKANQITRSRKQAPPPNRLAHTALIDATISRFQPEFFERLEGLGSDSAEPLFIVGMPRSGTTLMEQILSSHSDVGGVGESMYFSYRGHALTEPYKEVSAELVSDLSEGYLWHLRSITKGEARITDKMPFNYMFLGVVHALFPNARIIHCRRNAIDTCLSVFVTPIDFGFSNSLSDVAFYHHEYERLMAHWRTVIPVDRLIEVDYEDLVSDPEPVTRRLSSFIDLPWEAKMLDFTSNRRMVQTASNWQVRQPLHSNSLARWRRYEPWIGELLQEFPDTACIRKSVSLI